MALETYKKEQKKLEKEEEIELNDGVEKEQEETLTIKKILADKESSALFGKMIEESGGPEGKDMAVRLVDGKLEEGDVDSLEKYRASFEEKMHVVENLNEELTPELLDELGLQSPEFKKILNTLDSKTTSKMIKDRMAELAVSEPEHFDKISKKIEKLQDFKDGEFKVLDESVKKICEENNIDADDYLKALAINDPKKQEETLRNLVRDSWGEGGWGSTVRVLDKFSSLFGGGSKLIAEQLADQKVNIDAVFAELDKHKKGIGKVLATTVKGSNTMRDALSKALIGEPTKVEHIGMKDSKELLPKEIDIDTRWEEAKVDLNVGGKTWNRLNSVEKDKERKKFGNKIKAEAKKKSKGKGFWASIFEAIFGSFIDDKISKLN